MSTQLCFKKIQLRNFLSFGNSTTEIDLSGDGSTLILGENVDANSNNGAGKCVLGCTPINIRNKQTGEIVTMPISELYEKLQKSRR